LRNDRGRTGGSLIALERKAPQCERASRVDLDHTALGDWGRTLSWRAICSRDADAVELPAGLLPELA
jgi:hypothetical protein